MRALKRPSRIDAIAFALIAAGFGSAFAGPTTVDVGINDAPPTAGVQIASRDDTQLYYKAYRLIGSYVLNLSGERIGQVEVLIIDSEGKITYRDFSPTSEGKLRDELAKLLDVTEAAASEELPGQFLDDQGRQHLAPGQTYDFYNSDPPTSGPHAPAPAPWGSYDRPIPKETLVHNLEHGGILILYNCPGGCPGDVEQLKQFAERYLNEGRKLILAPYPGMDHKFALVAWTYLDGFDELDPNRIFRFMEANLGLQAPEAEIP